MTCNPIRVIPRNSLLGDHTKTRRFEHPIEVTVATCRPATFIWCRKACRMRQLRCRGIRGHPAIKNDSSAILNYQGTASDATATDLLCGLVGQLGVGEGDGGGVGKGVVGGIRTCADTGPGAFRMTQAIAAAAAISGIVAGRRTCDRR